MSWYAWMAANVPGAGHYFVHNQVTDRLVNDNLKRHPGVVNGLILYVPILLGGALPWAIVWPVSLSRTRPAILSKTWWLGTAHAPCRAVSRAGGRAAVFAALIAASSKLALYALPLVPALALDHRANVAVLRAIAQIPGSSLSRGASCSSR